MHPSVMTGFLVILAVSGCASMKAPSPSAEREVTPAAVPPAAAAQPVAPPTAAPPSEPEPATAAQPVAPPTAAPPSEPAPANIGSGQSSAPADTAAGAPSSVNPVKRSSPAKTTSTPGTRPAKTTGAAAAQSRPSAVPAAPATAVPATAATPPSSAAAPTRIPATASSPTLNLTDLEQRLRETRAIGVFTKLSLKNQVDDLLNAFRTLYRGPDKHPPAELRQRYDMLLMKVLSLLQDGDPPLAAAIASSREAIWGILADPEKFATI
jgi:hypothetical protein